MSTYNRFKVHAAKNTHDRHVTQAQIDVLTLMERETNIHTMTPSRTMKIFKNRQKRIMQVVTRATREHMGY